MEELKLMVCNLSDIEFELKYKKIDQKLRREASKQGYMLHKSRRRINYLSNFGGYMITDSRNVIIAGERYDMFINNVIEFLSA